MTGSSTRSYTFRRFCNHNDWAPLYAPCEITGPIVTGYEGYADGQDGRPLIIDAWYCLECGNVGASS